MRKQKCLECEREYTNRQQSEQSFTANLFSDETPAHLHVYDRAGFFYSRAGCNRPTRIVCYIFASVGVHVTHRPCLVSAWWWPAPPRWACNPESAWPSQAPVWRWSRSHRDPTPWTPLGSLPTSSKWSSEWVQIWAPCSHLYTMWLSVHLNLIGPVWTSAFPPHLSSFPNVFLPLSLFSQFRFRNSILPHIATSS